MASSDSIDTPAPRPSATPGPTSVVGELPIVSAAQRVADTPSPEVGLDVLVGYLAWQLGADGALLMTREPHEGTARLRSAWGLRDPDPSLRVAPGEGFLGARIVHGDAAVVRLDHGDVTAERLGLSVPGSAIAAAVRARGAIRGVIAATFSASLPSSPNASALAVTRGYAALAGMCVATGDEIAALRRANRVDGLTGCLNHTAILEALANEVSRSRRRHHTVACCLLDLDGFKAINDERGHLHGDRALTVIGQVLRRGVRSYDHVGRYGGDEFLIVMPETDERTAADLVHRLLDEIAAASAREGLAVTACAGVADSARDPSAIDMVDIADHRLRAAKSDEDLGSEHAGALRPVHRLSDRRPRA